MFAKNKLLSALSNPRLLIQYVSANAIIFPSP
jgi:hypothetical protein